jgi:filamentous hemagglutinin
MFKHATMNRAFKLVWNQARGAYVAVAETARGHAVSTSSTRIARALLVVTGAAASAALQAQVRPATTVVPASGNTNAYISGNGVPIVNIATPNAQGLSHNKYTRYDVEANGLVLNNGNTSLAARQSQLAGQVVGNVNLGREATTILNEVVSNRRSVLAGFTEVLGGKADVIVANPYGITCTGCGFINTDRVTLTTGVPNISLDGRLAGFSVTRGDVLINGVGLNATAQQMLDIVTRSLVVDGQINTAPDGTLGITTGLNEWGYDSRTVTGSTNGADVQPALAVDSSVLGGMYAGRIRLISTEAGVGVRMLGDAAAKVDDFQISSAGLVDIRSSVSAERDIQVASTSATQALSLSDARLSARRDLSLSGTGAASFQGGSLVANRALNVTVGSLTDRASAASLDDNNSRFGQTVSLSVGASAQVAGVAWGADGALTGQFGSLTVDADTGALLYAGSTLTLTSQGDLALNTAAVQATGHLSLSSSQGRIITTAGDDQGLQSTEGTVSLTARQGLALGGTLSSDSASVSLLSGGTVDLSGTTHAKTDLIITDLQGNGTVDVNNSGAVVAEQVLTIRARHLVNSGDHGLQGNGGTSITAQSLTNSATLVMSTQSQADGQLTLGTLSNTGQIQSARDLGLSVSGSATNGGTLLAARDLNLSAASLSVGTAGFVQAGRAVSLTTTGALGNEGSVIAGGQLTAQASTVTNRGEMQSQSGLSLTAGTVTNSGLINAAQGDTLQTLQLNVGQLNNQTTGVIQASDQLNIAAGVGVDNAGDLLAFAGDLSVASSQVGTPVLLINRGAASMVAGDTLSLGSASANNLNLGTQAGTLAAKAIELHLTGVNNTGAIEADTTLTIHASDSLVNSGSLYAGTDLTAKVGALIDNSGDMLARGRLAIRVLDNTRVSPLLVKNQGAGLMQALGAFTLGTDAERWVNFTQTQNAAVLADSIQLKAVGVDNDGLMQASTTLTALGLSSMENRGFGALLAGTTMELGAGTLGNQGTLQAQDGMRLTAGTLVNQGTVITSATRPAGETVDMVALAGHIVAGTLINELDALIQSGGDLNITARDVFTNNQSTILAEGDLTVQAQRTDTSLTLTNTRTAVIQAGGQLKIQGTTVDGLTGHNIDFIDQSGDLLGQRVNVQAQSLGNEGKIQSDQTLTINLLGSMENWGDILALGGLALDAQALTNHGTLTTGANNHNGRISVGAFSNSNTGVIRSLGDDGLSKLRLNVGSSFTNQGTLVSESNLDIQNSSADSTLLIDNQGVIQAGYELRLGTTSQVDLNNSEDGSVLATIGHVTTGNLLNRGDIDSTTLTINTTGLNNFGLISAARALNISGNDLFNRAGGVIQNATANADFAGTVQAVALTNAGTINLGKGSGWGTIQTSWLTNQAGGIIDSRSVQMSLNVGIKLDNRGTLHSNGRLEINAASELQTLDIQNQTGGVIEAGNDLRLGLLDGAQLGKVSVQDGQMLAGAELDFRLKSLVNQGVIQGGDPRANTFSSIVLEEALNNQAGGRITLSTGPNALQFEGGPKLAHQIIATDITNAGAIESGGDVLVYRTANSAFTNSGQVVVNGDLHFLTLGDSLSILDPRPEATEQYTVDNTGRIDVGGKLSLLGLKGLTIKRNATWLAGEFDAQAPTVTIENDAMLSTLGNLTLAANSLTLSGVNSRIVAATSGTGTATLTLTGSFSNPGAIHSGDKLLMKALNITNTATGGISALSDLKILATNSVENSGALYAGNELWVQTTDAANGRITNKATTGTMDAGSDIMLIAAHLTNQNAIDSAGDITLDSADLKNEISGSIKPTVIAAETLTVKGFNTALNKGALMAADTIVIAGLGGSTSFTNDPAGKTGAGIYANTLVAGGTSLTSMGSPEAPEVNTKTQSGLTRFNLSDALNLNGGSALSDGAVKPGTSGSMSPLSKAKAKDGKTLLSAPAVTGSTADIASLLAANKAAGISGTQTASGAPAIGFPGLVIALPSNPNGYFVISKDPQAQFLVETNPLFKVGQNFVGSNYLAQRYGYNPDVAIKRLGDSNYEANLVKQQLVKQTGANLLKTYKSEAAQMQGLMDSAVVQGRNLGLTYGAAPTAEQLKNLTADIVWMVETEVNGQRVLAPVVYLADKTRSGIAQGSVISGNDVVLDVSSLTNTGGTIQGSNTLDITSKGDVTNTGGTIKGGAVSVVSTEGSIVNRTTSRTVDTATGTRTVIGKTATIEATQSLNLDAKKDITNIGAQVKSAGDARLKAGGNITFDTLEDKTTSTTSSTTKSKGRKTTETTSTTTVNQVKSGLTVGGNLAAQAGNDLTLAGTDVNVGGSALLKAGNNVNLVARENSSDSTTSTSSKGTGTFGSLKGSSSSTTNTQQTRNVGTTLNVGGNAAVVAGQTALVQGSDIKAGGNVVLKGADVKVLAGQDTDTSASTSQSSKKGLSTSGGGLSFSQSSTTTTNTNRSTSVGSNIQSGGSVLVDATQDVTVQGSNVTAAKDLVVSATTVNVLAARNVDTSTTSTSQTSTGLYFDSTNSAGVSGNKAGNKGQGAQGSAQASGSIGSQNNLDLVRQTTTTTSTQNVTNTGSQLGAGGVLVIQAKDKATVQGSSLSGDEGVMVKGKNLEFLAAENSSTTTTTTTSRSTGLYADASASAEGSARAGVGTQGNGAQAKGEGEARASAGVQVRQSTDTSTSGNTTAQVSTITSKSGNVVRQADERLLDVGTAIEAGGMVVQKANTIDSLAARNTTFSSTDSNNSSARAGAFAGADGQANRGAYASGSESTRDQAQQVMNSGGAGSQSSAGRGVEVQVTNDRSNSQSNTSTAVVSTIKAGGGVSSTSTGRTTMEGTQIQAAGDVALSASALDYTAARNTQSSSSSSTAVELGAEVGKSKSVTLSGSREASQSREDASQAVVGGIQSGGQVTVNTAGDTRLEGTRIRAAGDTTVSAGGNLSIEAARDERSSSASANSVGGEIEVGKGKKGKPQVEGGKLDASVSEAQNSSSNATGASIESGGTVKLSAGKTATLEGTDVTARQGVTVDGAKVDLQTAQSTQTRESFSADISMAVSKGDAKKGDSGGKTDSQGKGNQSVVGGSLSASNSSTGQQKGVNISGGEGGLKVNGQATEASPVSDSTPRSPEAPAAEAKAKKPKKKTQVKKAEATVGSPAAPTQAPKAAP